MAAFLRFIYIVVVSDSERLSTAMVFWLDWLVGNPTRLAESQDYIMEDIWAPYLSNISYIHTTLRYRATYSSDSLHSFMTLPHCRDL